MRRAVLLVFAVLVSTFMSLGAQTATGPRPLYSTAAAFDPVRGRLVVFGGFGNGGYSGETWEWDGGSWLRNPSPGPAPRNFPVMVFDNRRERMILFGGDTRDQIFGDTWSYDGREWKKLADIGPEARSTHTMAYDSTRDRVVLFGGFSRHGQNGSPAGIRNDTWEFDGVQWKLVAESGPAARTLHAMAYDASSNKTVLFGGSKTSAGPPPAGDTLGDTWEWDGTKWTEIKGGTMPPPRDHVDMAFDPLGGRLVMAGGHKPGGGQIPDVWQRIGKAWSRVNVTGTPALAGHHVIFDAKASRMLLFGGFGPGQGPTTDVWALSGSAWTRAFPR